MGAGRLTALVTGGASGLGRATVARLRREGHGVILADRSEAGAEVAAELGATFARCDVTVAAEVESALDALDDVSVAVNCAGVGFAKRTVSSKGAAHGLEDFTRVMRVNTEGTFNVVRLAAERFTRRQPDAQGQRGVVVMTASIAAYEGQIGQVAYAASKGAIASMTLPLARDLAVHGIRVCTIAPGLFRTPLLEALPEQVQNELGASVPFPSRLGHPAEFAHLVSAILENPLLNGSVLRLDGALRMPP